MEYILAIDQGTTSSRAILFDKKMDLVSLSQKEFPQYFPNSGWVEHDPEEIWDSVFTTCKEVMEKAGVTASDIKGIKEMILDCKTGYLFEKNNSKILSEKIENFFMSKKDYSSDIENFRERFSWDEFSAKIQLLYKSL